MPVYKLKYFNIRGRAEIARLMFAESGQDYEDIRIEYKDWPNEKPKTPFGHLPVLLIDNAPLPQSGTIVRFLAKQLNLEPEGNIQSAFADMMFETVMEALQKGRPHFLEQDEEKKTNLIKEWFENTIAPIFAKFDKELAEKKKNFLIGQKISYIDIAMMNALTILDGMKSGFSDDYPALKALSERVKERPNIKKWLETRPVTDF